MHEPFFFRYFWMAGIAVNLVNALVLKSRSRSFIEQRPELAAGYAKLFYGVIFWGSLPWIVMGAGMVSGGVPSLISYFHPRDGNPFVIAFFGIVILLWLLGFYWLFVRRGAEFIVEHPGLFQGDPKSPAMIRAIYCLGVTGGVIAVLVICFTDFVPRLP
jgi:hypothetical protein